MITLRTIFASAAACLAFVGVAHAACAIDLQHRAPMVFAGRLELKVFPGPPDFRDVRRGDQPEPTFILALDKPLCATGAEFLDKGDLITFGTVHLVPGGANVATMQKTLRSLVGRRIEARAGTLFEAHTGHHHAPIVAEIESVSSR